MKNIYFMELNGTPYYVFLPYVYGVLRAAAEEDPEIASAYVFKEPCFVMWKPEQIVNKLEEPAVLGLSCYVWNFRKQMKIAKLCKARHPDTLVVAGGPHIPNRIDDFFLQHPYVDLLVHGEGELPFKRILRENLAAHPDFSGIPGVTWRRVGKAASVPRERLDLAKCVHSPYLKGFLNRSIALCRALKLDFYAPWETNRGCPYSCSFCDWGSNTMSKIRKFDDARLQQEIAFFGAQRIPNVHINDANFGILKRDLGLAEHFAEVRRRTGFPGSVVTNWAKNSNEQVFRIGKLWTDQGLFKRQGLTLSMQATNQHVLAAIKRENIGIERYRALQRRYADAHIHTYSEIIMGLPEETRESFKRGLDPLLALERHDDIRIYDFAVLPNAPVAEPASMAAHGIQTIEKHMSPASADTPEDEIERMAIAIATRTMPRAHWVECAVYAQMIRVLHNGGYTRYLANHLHRAYDIAFHRFYDGLLQQGLACPHTLLGLLWTELCGYYRRYQQSAAIPEIELASSPAAALPLLQHMPAVAVRPADWAWICIAACRGQFYAELMLYMESLGMTWGDEVAELLRFQEDIMLSPDYDPNVGKEATYAFDFPGYIGGDPLLRRRQTRVRFCDRAMGANRQHPLEAGNPVRFVHAALGGVAGHFQHQLDVADISYPGDDQTEVDEGQGAAQ